MPGPGLVFGSRYVADDTYSHNAEASVTLTIKADGTCQARIWQSKTALSGTLPCGNAVPSGGMASQYEVQFVADQMVPTVDAPYCNSDDLNPTYTPTTGWLALGSVDRSVVAQTAHVMGNTYGCTGSFESAIEGVYRVRVRKIGETAYSEVVMEFLARAQAGA